MMSELDTLLDVAVSSATSYLKLRKPRPSGLDVLHAYGMETMLHDHLVTLYKDLAREQRLGSLDLETYKLLALATVADPKPNTRVLVTELGSRGDLYPNRDVWVLYWAALLAQHRFSLLFCGSGSHEERLTGHLVSELSAARDQIMRALARLSWLWSGPSGRSIAGELVANKVEKIRAEIAYADVARGRQEALTGGDLGLVLVRPRHGGGEFVPIRIQAKKASASGTASIAATTEDPLSQLRNLLASRIGYYLYYYPARPELGSLAPIIQSAEDANASRVGLRADPRRGGVDFATFVLEMLVGRRAAQGEDDMKAAVGRLMAGERRPLMVLAMSGAPALEGDLFTLLEDAVAPYRDVLVETDEADDTDSGTDDLGDVDAPRRD